MEKSNRLMSMTDFILRLEEKNGGLGEKEYTDIWNYTLFLKEPLALWMLVPCDEDGKPLEKPKEYDYSFYTHKNMSVQEEYEKAKSRVIFEGFVLNGSELYNKELNISIYLDTYEYVEHHDNGYGGGNLSGINIEALANAHLKITLTETAKQIYGS